MKQLFMHTLTTVDRNLHRLMFLICTSCFVLLFLLLAGNVFIRNFPFMEIYWFDEVVEFAFAWMVFFGAAKLWAMNSHFKLEWLYDQIKNPKHRRLFRIAIETISLIFLVIFTWQSFRLTLLAKDWTPVFNLSKRYLYACMPIAGMIMTGYSIAAVLREFRSYFISGTMQRKGIQ